MTLEWWDYNRHSRVTSFLGASSIRAEQKPLFQLNQIHLSFKHIFLRLKSVPYVTDFPILCGFLVALDRSAVPLYGDVWSITTSASNRLCPPSSIRAEQKPLFGFVQSKSYLASSMSNFFPSLLHFPYSLWYNKNRF